MWFEVALVGSFFSAVSTLLNRKILREKPDSFVYSLFFSTICSIFSLPLFIYFFDLPSNFYQWTGILVLSGIAVLFNYLIFTGYKYVSVSWARTLSQTKYVWIILFGMLFLSEFISQKALFGMVLIVAGSLLAIWQGKDKNSVSARGIILILASALVMASYSIITKVVLKDISPYVLVFFLFFFPAIVNFILIRDVKNRSIKLWKVLPKGYFVMIGIFAVLMNLCLLIALSYGNVAQVTIVFEFAAIFLILGEYFFLKERENLWKKALALVLAAIGVILVRS